MILETIIRKLKRDPHYKWESSYSIRELLIIGFDRAFQIARGLTQKWFLRKSDGLLFIGKNVILKHKHNISSGRNLILDDNVSINALSYNGISFGDNVTIGRDSIFVCTGVIAQKGIGIRIGSGTGINARAFFGGQGGINIGKNVIIGPDVKIFSENHNFRDDFVDIKKQGVTRKGVRIDDNCWIGSGVIIVDGVTIGCGCVIAAGSVVTKSIPENSLAAGVPAKIIGDRVASVAA